MGFYYETKNRKIRGDMRQSVAIGARCVAVRQVRKMFLRWEKNQKAIKNSKKFFSTPGPPRHIAQHTILLMPGWSVPDGIATHAFLKKN